MRERMNIDSIDKRISGEHIRRRNRRQRAPFKALRLQGWYTMRKCELYEITKTWCDVGINTVTEERHSSQKHGIISFFRRVDDNTLITTKT